MCCIVAFRLNRDFHDFPDYELGTLKIKVLTGSFPSRGVGVFGRKASPYVLISYGSSSAHTTVRYQAGSEPRWDQVLTIPLSNEDFEILIEVFDQKYIEEEDSGTSANGSGFGGGEGFLMCSAKYNIKHWRANSVFQGYIDLLDPRNKKDENYPDKLQVDVKIEYSHGRMRAGSTHSSASGTSQNSTSAHVSLCVLVIVFVLLLMCQLINFFCAWHYHRGGCSTTRKRKKCLTSG